ncbi:cupin domain-containing protein [Enterobacter cloacae]|uniref:cupin domain-containing protein n=1 Tax=Enterobacter cloacae TaxID=550 RepID=UPI001CC74623|nr:cupin domain-containing protein [Enterobacter cloacae]
MPAFEWVHVQLHQQKGMISLSPPTICNSAVWHVHPGQEIAAHIHPHGQDTWTVLSGMADYFQGNGIVRALREGEIAVARPGQVHGARNTGTEPFVLVSVVASANAGFVLAER